MPPASGSGHFYTEKALDVRTIADVQEIESEDDTRIVFDKQHEHKGVLLVELSQNDSGDGNKKRRVGFRALILGQSFTKPGEVVFYRKAPQSFQTARGMDLSNQGGIKVPHVHWCSGLQLKWIPGKTAGNNKASGSFAEKMIQKGRVDLAKKLVDLIDEPGKWSDVAWDEVDDIIDAVQPQRDTKRSPKKRQVAGGKKPRAKKHAVAAKAAKVPTATATISQDWTSSRHIVDNCQFDIDDSLKLDKHEKDAVKDLMVSYIKDVDFDEQHNRQLARLLNKAFVRPFSIKILHDFIDAKAANFKLGSLQTFADFATWWEQKDTSAGSSGSRSRSRSSSNVAPARKIPSGKYFEWRIRNMMASLIKKD